MKRFTALLALSALFALPAFAQDDAAVYSANAVGVIKYTIPARGGMVCISVPLYAPSSDSWTWGDMSIADQLPQNSSVYFWNGTGWDPFTKGSRGWNATAKAKEIQLGESFFVQSPSTAADDITLSLLGELPTESSLTYSVRGGNQLDMQAATVYPVPVTFGDTELAASLSQNSVVYFWSDGKWEPYSKGSRGWNATAKAQSIGVGEGMFIQEAGSSAVSVSVTRPFDW